MKAKAPHTGAARPVMGSESSAAKDRNDAIEMAEGIPAAGPSGATESVRKGALFHTPATTESGANEAVRQAHTHSISAEDARSSSGKAEAVKKMHTHSRGVE